MVLQISEIQNKRLAKLAKRYDNDNDGQLKGNEFKELQSRVSQVIWNSNRNANSLMNSNTIAFCAGSGLASGILALLIGAENPIIEKMLYKAPGIGILLGILAPIVGEKMLQHRHDKFCDYDNKIKQLDKPEKI